jgi:hypothetical protein
MQGQGQGQGQYDRRDNGGRHGGRGRGFGGNNNFGGRYDQNFPHHMPPGGMFPPMGGGEFFPPGVMMAPGMMHGMVPDPHMLMMGHMNGT